MGSFPFPGAGIGMVDGTGDYLTTPYSSDFNFGSGNFTIEFSFYLTALSADVPFIAINDATGSANRWVVYYDNTGKRFYIYTVVNGTATTVIRAPATITTGIWYQLAYVKNGSSWYCFRNGQSLSFTSGDPIAGSTAFPTCNAGLIIGAFASTTMAGYLSELRISDVALYTANFTPPRTQLQSDSNTKLLLHFLGSGNTFVDSSPSPKTITAYGDAKQAYDSGSICSGIGIGSPMMIGV